MAKDGKTMVVPRLRFPGFGEAGEWKEKPLKDVCAVNPPSNGLPESFVYIDLESVEGGSLNARNHINKKDAPSRAQRLLRNGDVVFQIVRPYQRNNLFVQFNDDETYVASTGYAQLRAHDSERFLYQAVHTDTFVEKVISKCTGSSYPAINSSDLADIFVFIPPTPQEQQKIADCLTSLDEVIAAQWQKVEALKTWKRGLMQQLFPREGESVPRLRFPEFREAGEWEQSQLGSIALILKGKGVAKSDVVPNGARPCIRYGELYTRYGEVIETVHSRTDASVSDLFLSRKQDIIIPASGETKLDITTAACVLHDDVALGSDLNVLRTNHNGVFLSYLLNGSKRYEIARVAQGDTVVHLYPSQLQEIVIATPSPGEQQKIADILSFLDAKLTTESEKLDTLKAHKKGLMQQLFPTMDNL
jgi:type I restriction enzyme S subunit